MNQFQHHPQLHVVQSTLDNKNKDFMHNAAVNSQEPNDPCTASSIASAGTKTCYGLLTGKKNKDTSAPTSAKASAASSSPPVELSAIRFDLDMERYRTWLMEHDRAAPNNRPSEAIPESKATKQLSDYMDQKYWKDDRKSVSHLFDLFLSEYKEHQQPLEEKKTRVEQRLNDAKEEIEMMQQFLKKRKHFKETSERYKTATTPCEEASADVSASKPSSKRVRWACNVVTETKTVPSYEFKDFFLDAPAFINDQVFISQRDFDRLDRGLRKMDLRSPEACGGHHQLDTAYRYEDFETKTLPNTQRDADQAKWILLCFKEALQDLEQSRRFVRVPSHLNLYKKISKRHNKLRAETQIKSDQMGDSLFDLKRQQRALGREYINHQAAKRR